jgi:polyhydroxybutyrate depolymerase
MKTPLNLNQKRFTGVTAFTAMIASLLFFVLTTGHAADLARREWKVDGVTREALVHVPKDEKITTHGLPVVFAFHGHGGSMHNAAKTFHIETIWPEAIVVYMHGLNTPGHISDFEGKLRGWQRTVGDQKDRDLKFFDAVLSSLKRDYKVDDKRIYSTGHSNGGAFTYLLWEARGKEFAAFAPSACATISLFGSGSERNTFIRALNDEDKSKLDNVLKNHLPTNSQYLPKPVLHLAGLNDDLVKFRWQKATIEALRRFNQCAEGKPWDSDKRCNLYKSKVNADVITWIHPGTHKYPEEAPAIIVSFFKAQRLE